MSERQQEEGGGWAGRMMSVRLWHICICFWNLLHQSRRKILTLGEMRKKQVASWTAVTGIWLSNIKICLASANLKSSGLLTGEPWAAETDGGLLNSKDYSCLGILKLPHICTRCFYRSCALRASCEKQQRIWIYMWRKGNLMRQILLSPSS